MDPRPKDQRAVQGCRCEIGHFEVIVAEEQAHKRTAILPVASATRWQTMSCIFSSLFFQWVFYSTRAILLARERNSKSQFPKHERWLHVGDDPPSGTSPSPGAHHNLNLKLPPGRLCKMFSKHLRIGARFTWLRTRLGQGITVPPARAGTMMLDAFRQKKVANFPSGQPQRSPVPTTPPPKSNGQV